MVPAAITGEQDWGIFIMLKLAKPFFIAVTKDLKDFMIANRGLYYRRSGGILVRVLSTVEAKKELQGVHELSCENNDVSLCRRLRQGYYGRKWSRKWQSYSLLAYNARSP